MIDNKDKRELSDEAMDEVVGGSIRVPTSVTAAYLSDPSQPHTVCDRCHGTFAAGVVTEHAVSSGYLWLCPACVQAYKDAGLYFHKADI